MDSVAVSFSPRPTPFFLPCSFSPFLLHFPPLDSFRTGFKTMGTAQAEALSDSPRARNQRPWSYPRGSLSLFPLTQNESTPKQSLWLGEGGVCGH